MGMFWLGFLPVLAVAALLGAVWLAERPPYV